MNRSAVYKDEGEVLRVTIKQRDHFADLYRKSERDNASLSESLRNWIAAAWTGWAVAGIFITVSALLFWSCQ